MAVRVPVVHYSRIIDTALKKTRYCVLAQLENFNDNEPRVVTGDLSFMQNAGTPVLVAASVLWTSTTCGDGIRCYAYLLSDANRSIFLGHFNSTAYVVDGIRAGGYFPIPDLYELAPTTPFIHIAFSGPGLGHALDDIRISMEIECYTEVTEAPIVPPMPVSLEGYKWPLTRRRI